MAPPIRRFNPLMFALAGVSLGAAGTPAAWPQPPAPAAGAPNVVIVLLDDVGFGTSGTFGGPAQTPALDQLAAEGLRYNRFHTTALSSPTRASLLTGRNHHQVGFGVITETAAPAPGYNTIWPGRWKGTRPSCPTPTTRSADGGRLGGYSLYLKEGRLIYEYNWFGKHHWRVASRDPLPAGTVEVAAEFTPRSAEPWAGGSLKLFVNGLPAGHGTLEATGMPSFVDTFDIGADRGSPVSKDDASPYPFTGTIKLVRLTLL